MNAGVVKSLSDLLALPDRTCRFAFTALKELSLGQSYSSATLAGIDVPTPCPGLLKFRQKSVNEKDYKKKTGKRERR